MDKLIATVVDAHDKLTLRLRGLDQDLDTGPPVYKLYQCSTTELRRFTRPVLYH